MKAKGLYVYIQSKPDDWDFSGDRIAKNETSDGRASIYAGLDELENSWYLHRIKWKNKLGQWEIEYVLYEVPTEKSIVENQQWQEWNTVDDFPQSDFPQSENRQTIKRRNTKQEIQNSIVVDIGEKEFPLLSKKLIEFIDFRKEIKKPIKDASKSAFLKSLGKLSGWDEETAVAILDQSIANGWQGIFEIKGKRKPKNNVWTVYADASSWF